MIVLEPIFDYRIWGGCQLCGAYGENARQLAHLYSVYSSRGKSNIALNGEHRGKPLGLLFAENKSKWGMLQYEKFPLTIALVDAQLDLSIQVHPDDEMARLLDDMPGKCESWYFLTAPSGGYIYNGCKPELAGAIDSLIGSGGIGSGGRAFAQAIDTLPIAAGDYVCVKPRTVHAITAGSLVYEIEHGSNLTYRLYDYGRVDEDGDYRELHIDKGIRALSACMKSSVKRYNPPEPIIEKAYSTRLMENLTSYKNSGNSLECLTSLSEKTFFADGAEVKKGMTVMLEPGERVDAAINICIIANLT